MIAIVSDVDGGDVGRRREEGWGWGSLNAVGCRMKIALHVNGEDNRQTNA